MSKVNYEKVGFKSGLEIHQQLDTHKLFCNCPSVLRKDDPDFEIKRKLHVVAGETGKVDVAAEYQASLDKEFIYQGYDTTCLVELDEEPPHEINKEALRIALEISLLLNCKIVPIAQVMRKTVIDGSNTSGFQRSVLIARDGYVETENGKVGIDTVFLEEDSARPVKRTKNSVVYRLDRLGIPLVEIATKPDIKNANQAKEVALKIGDILRSCKVRRGIGTIRQDINISIKGSNRVEVKGFQDPKIMIKAIENEVLRQQEILTKGKVNDLEVRNCLADGTTEFLRPMPGAARMYPETDVPLLKISRDLINDVKKNLPKLKSDLEDELRSTGLSEDMIKILFKENKLEDYKELLKIIDKPMLVAKVMFLYENELAKKLSEVNRPIDKIKKILDDSLAPIFEALNSKKIFENQIKEVMENVVLGKSVEEAIKIEKADLGDIEEKIMKMIKEKPGLNPNAYMGLVMKEFKGAVSGSEAMRIINKFLK